MSSQTCSDCKHSPFEKGLCPMYPLGNTYHCSDYRARRKPGWIKDLISKILIYFTVSLFITVVFRAIGGFPLDDKEMVIQWVVSGIVSLGISKIWDMLGGKG